MKTVHVISVSGGKDSTATLLIALDRVPRESIQAIFCDTGNEIPITYKHLDELERHLGIQITRLKADFSREIIAKRRFVAQDQRTRREYKTAPVFDANGNPVPKRDHHGNVLYRTVRRGGVSTQELVQKTRKIGGGRKVRWSNKAKRRALNVLHPTGNPFLDLCLWKGRFPSRKAQFCTEELKRNMAVAYQLQLIDQGLHVVSWQGIRRDESPNRRYAKKMERIGPKLWACRPLVDWTAQQTVDFVRGQGCPLNPLYSQGQSRVGCVCINSNKSDLAQVSFRYPEEITRLSEWEHLVGQASKRGYSTFMCDASDLKDRRAIFSDLNIHARVAWAKGENGTMDLFDNGDLNLPACASSYGLCDQ
ncbi:phosphoadenosine phosphosulfate reductase family protein [Acidithiobacillus sp. HP-6]|nr:phosphoadenosine phosphosulfate reductase family protein [Acidithiobacillus sp. HP-6]MBE7570476.1 phosphoadenosine phosphosulfate reductase family protein [Acidithiobacillus sp. HP-2]